MSEYKSNGEPLKLGPAPFSCHFLHKWSKWNSYVNKTIPMYQDEERQYRICLNCGLIEDIPLMQNETKRIIV